MSVHSNQLASLPAHRDPNCFCLILIAFVITCTSGTTWAGIKSLTPIAWFKRADSLFFDENEDSINDSVR